MYPLDILRCLPKRQFYLEVIFMTTLELELELELEFKLELSKS
jgi:hypothetical protein